MRKRWNTIGGILLVGAVIWFGFQFVGAEQRVRQVCDLIKPGTTFVDVERVSLDHGMTLPDRYLPHTHIVEKKTFGRYGCEIDMKDGWVTGVKYNYAD